jgi:hypothetical protein
MLRDSERIVRRMFTSNISKSGLAFLAVRQERRVLSEVCDDSNSPRDRAFALLKHLIVAPGRK